MTQLLLQRSVISCQDLEAARRPLRGEEEEEEGRGKSPSYLGSKKASSKVVGSRVYYSVVSSERLVCS